MYLLFCMYLYLYDIFIVGVILWSFLFRGFFVIIWKVDNYLSNSFTAFFYLFYVSFISYESMSPYGFLYTAILTYFFGFLYTTFFFINHYIIPYLDDDDDDDDDESFDSNDSDYDSEDNEEEEGENEEDNDNFSEDEGYENLEVICDDDLID